MAEERPRKRYRKFGTPGGVAAVALAAIVAAWIITTFGGGVAGAYDGAMNRLFTPSDEELRSATTEYFESLSYEGSDGDEFTEQIEPTVVEDSFYSSSAGDSAGGMVEYLAEELDKGGLTRTEYELTDFEAQSAGRNGATAMVEVDSTWYEDGETASRLVTSEEISFAETEDGWKVAGAKVIETLEDAQG